VYNRGTCLAFLVFVTGLVGSARAEPTDTAPIKALEDRLATAAEARDLDAIMQAYVPDESLFVFDVIPPRQYVGAKAFRKDWDDFLASTKGRSSMQSPSLLSWRSGTSPTAIRSSGLSQPGRRAIRST
jgi:hypothetical protein